MISQHGLKTYSNFKVTAFSPIDHTYTIENNDQILKLQESTFNEIMDPKRNDIDKNLSNKDKLLESQYLDYFQVRDNTANNFKHNFSVYCRKEANSPCDALKIARKIISQMSKTEMQKTQALLTKTHPNEEINQALIGIYHEAIKAVPLNETYITRHHPEKKIALPFYDTISSPGSKINNNPALITQNKDHNPKIGDYIENINISTQKIFGKGNFQIHYDKLKIISASKEGNSITLMDKNNSFIEVPFDTVLKHYEQSKMKQIKKERIHQNKGMSISYIS